MSSISPMAEQRVVLSAISWTTYLALARESEHNRGRMSYDRGELEIMSPLLSHESAKRILGRMIERFTEYHGVDMRSTASTTFRRTDLQRGFEADESYYVANAAKIRGKVEVDLSIDPPPDLVVEIEMTRSSLNKAQLFASMGIREVWRYDGQVLAVAALQQHAYVDVTLSRVLPGFPIPLAQELLSVRSEESETLLIREFVKQLGQ